MSARQDWDWIHAVNAKGVFFCMQAVAREMAKRKEGKVINIASIAGQGLSGHVEYLVCRLKGGRYRHDPDRRLAARQT